MGGKIQRIKRLRFAGDSVLFALLVLFLYIFIKAYLNGFKIEININRYGEAKVELIVLLGVILPLATLALVYSYLDLVSTWKARQWIASTDYQMLDRWRREVGTEPIQLKCVNCGRSFTFDPLTAPGRYVRLTCPNCGESGIVDVLSIGR
ncbi:MAG: hypothetical protein J7L88_05020, partial [Thermoplasmata archaeon]|nr:hypothetical protein [Thermoplasmata archaeon]